MLQKLRSRMDSELSLVDTAGTTDELCFHTGTTCPWTHSLADINLTSPITNTSDNISHLEGSGETLLSLETRTSLIVLYTFTILFSVAGNIIVVIVFTKGGRSRTDIRPFLINLAIADLIMAVFCMPFTFTYVMTRSWIFSKPMCPIVLFMQHLSVSASVFTNMAIGIDRFLVVTFPLRARMTTRRARYVIFIIWVCAISLSSVQLVVARARMYQSIVHCNEQWTSPEARRTFTMFVMFITYVIPLVILAVTYTIISILLWKRTAPGNAHEGRDLQQLKGKRKVIKMLVIVVIMFGVCWLPLHIFFLVLDFNPDLSMNASKADKQLFTMIYYVVFWLAMSNSCANPVIYGFTNDSFRNDLASLCHLCFPFCLCLKHVANSRLSVSTLDSVNCKKLGTSRKYPGAASSRHGGYRHDNRMYLELKGDSYRSRTLDSPNEFYKRSKERESWTSGSNGSRAYLDSYSRQYSHRHHHRLCFKTDSGDSSVVLTTPSSNTEYNTISSQGMSNGSHKRQASLSPSTPGTIGFSITSVDDSDKPEKLNTFEDIDFNERVYFQTV